MIPNRYPELDTRIGQLQRRRRVLLSGTPTWFSFPAPRSESPKPFASTDLHRASRDRIEARILRGVPLHDPVDHPVDQRLLCRHKGIPLRTCFHVRDVEVGVVSEDLVHSENFLRVDLEVRCRSPGLTRRADGSWCARWATSNASPTRPPRGGSPPCPRPVRCRSSASLGLRTAAPRHRFRASRSCHHALIAYFPPTPPGAPQDAPLKGGATELVLMDARPLPKDHTQIGRRADVTFWLRPGGDHR